jgi:hypothetical protein
MRTSSLGLACAFAFSSMMLGCGDAPGGGNDDLAASGGDDLGGTPAPYGLDERPANTTCVPPARPPVVSGGDITLVPAFPNLQTTSHGAGMAIGLLRSRVGASGPMRWFVVERHGVIWTFVDPNASKDGLAADGTTPVERAEVFLDLPENV